MSIKILSEKLDRKFSFIPSHSDFCNWVYVNVVKFDNSYKKLSAGDKLERLMLVSEALHRRLERNIYMPDILNCIKQNDYEDAYEMIDSMFLSKFKDDEGRDKLDLKFYFDKVVKECKITPQISSLDISPDLLSLDLLLKEKKQLLKSVG